MKEQHSKNDRHRIMIVLATIATASGFIALLFSFFSDRTERISTSHGNQSVSALSCQKSDANDSFFNVSDAENVDQEIKVTFGDDRIASIMYVTSAAYNDSQAARINESAFRAFYDKYMTKHGLNVESISADFSVSDSEVRVKLYAEQRALNAATIQIFLLDSDSHTSQSLQKTYKSKGFVCNYKE